MSYIALKPCSFAGLNYLIGNEVPEEVLQPASIKSLIKMGVIAATGNETTVADAQSPAESAQSPEKVSIHVEVDEGTLELCVPAEGLQQLFNAMLVNVGQAEKAVEQMTDVDTLVLLSLVDSRKSIKAAAEARAKAINEESAGEQ